MKKFTVIVADPPYPFYDKLQQSDVKRGAAANYDVMTISDIRQLNVKNLIHPDGSVLALWVPSSLLQEGLDTMKDWGFDHKQTYIWVKTKKVAFSDLAKALKKALKDSNKSTLKAVEVNKMFRLATQVFSFKDTLAFGMGRLFRQSHEIALIGTSNNGIYRSLENKSQRSVCLSPNLKHSSKPENLQDSLDMMFPKSDKIELFARRLRPGWVCLGNEVCNGEDIRDSLLSL